MINTPPNEGAMTALIVLSKAPGLLVRLTFTYMKFKRKAKKSARALKKGMRKAGMDKKMANELAEAYEVTFSIREFIKGQGISIPGLSNIFG